MNKNLYSAQAPRLLRASMALIAALPLILFCSFAFATPLVADLSNYNISMDANFNGTRIFLFGARNDAGDIVVVVRGPAKNFMVRKKEEVAGIWVNHDRMKFYNVPDFYAIASSKPLAEINQPALFTALRIGENYLIPAPSDISKMAKFNEFEQAFLDHHTAKKLYTDNPEPITFMGETLFKTAIDFSDNIPPGEYTAEVYLISDGEITGMQSTPIHVEKSGLDAFIYHFAHQSPALYGLAAICIALLAGWLASRLFEQRT